jgi:hypothetical protein
MTASSVPDMAACRGPLSEYCQGSCPTYDQVVAIQRAANPCLRSLTGTCGSWSVIDYYGLGIGEHHKLYFDASGTMVAAHHETDTNEFCSHTSFSEDYGSPVACTFQLKEILCNCAGDPLGVPPTTTCSPNDLGL